MVAAGALGWSEVASQTCDQGVSFGQLQDGAVERAWEGAAILEGLNPGLLPKGPRWRAFLWKLRRHWAIVLRPEAGDSDGEEAAACQVDTDLLRYPSATALDEVPRGSLFLVYELLVDSRSKAFFLRFCVHPTFDVARSNVQELGCFGPLRLEDVAGRAIGVIRRYRQYGVIGCNCQHFAVDFLKELDVEASVRTDDLRAEQAAERGVKAFSMAHGAFRGLSAVVGGYSQASAATSAAGAAAGAGGAGAVVMSAHILAGVAVGYAASAALGKGYLWVCKRHRRVDSGTSADEVPSLRAGEGLDEALEEAMAAMEATERNLEDAAVEAAHHATAEAAAPGAVGAVAAASAEAVGEPHGELLEGSGGAPSS